MRIAILLILLFVFCSGFRKPIFISTYVSNGERAGNFINWPEHPEFTFMADEFPDGVKEMQMTKKGTLNIARLGSEFGADYVD